MGCLFCEAIGCDVILSDSSGAPLSGLVLMLSAPTAIPTSIEPAMIWLAMFWIASNPEEQNRLATDAAAVTGKPAAKTAERAM